MGRKVSISIATLMVICALISGGLASPFLDRTLRELIASLKEQKITNLQKKFEVLKVEHNQTLTKLSQLQSEYTKLKGENTKLQNRELKTRPQLARRGIPTSPLSVKTIGTFTSNNIEVILKSCEVSNFFIQCKFLITNIDDKYLFVRFLPSSEVYDNSGNEYLAHSAYIGNNSSFSSKRLPPKLRTNATLTFSVGYGGSFLDKQIQLLRIEGEFGDRKLQTVSYRNVPLIIKP